MSGNIIDRGGSDPERLYLQDLKFGTPDGQIVTVKATKIADVDMDDLIARHKGRYCQVGLFCRLVQRVLDFPCGSGYAAEILCPLGVYYEGLELDPFTVEYANRVHGSLSARFGVGDLRFPHLEKERYDASAASKDWSILRWIFKTPLPPRSRKLSSLAVC